MRISDQILGIVLRCVGFLALVFVLLILCPSRLLDPFLFFEQRDPPAADPHRTAHLRDYYFFAYGGLGILLGYVAAVRAPFVSAVLTIVASTYLLFALRYHGSPELFNPQSEEGYYGAPAIFTTAVAVSGAIAVGRWWSRVKTLKRHDT